MKFILTILLFTLSCTAYANGFKTEDDAKKYTDSLLKIIVQEDFEKAFDSAKPYWPLPIVEIDGLVNTIKQQWPIVNQRFGKSISSELVKTKHIGQSFIRYYYVHKFENHAIYWKIDYYKPRSLWKINNILFADDLNTLYE